MSTFAIGDVHGCLRALDTLLEFLPSKPEDTLVFLGDYVDRGPNSREVLERLIELSTKPNFVALLGNHDVWMLRARSNEEWFKSWLSRGVGGVQTLESYDGSLKNVPEAHWRFLSETCVNFWETNAEIFVHAAADAHTPVPEQTEHWLLWERVYNIEQHESGKRVVCGHTSQKNGLPLDLGHAVCIDTFCHGGGWLSALCVETGQVWQANERGKTRVVWLDEG